MSDLGDQLQDEVDAILSLQTAAEKGTGEDGDPFADELDAFAEEVQRVFDDAEPDAHDHDGETIAPDEVTVEQINSVHAVDPTIVADSSFADVGAYVTDLISTHGDGPGWTKIDLSGEFALSTTIDPEAGDNILLDLYGAVLRLPDGTDANVIGNQTFSSNVANWRILGGLIDCNGSNQSNLATGIRFHGGSTDGSLSHSNIKAIDVTVVDPYLSGITISADDSAIESCLTTGWAAHGLLIGGKGSRIVDSDAGASVDRGQRDWEIAITPLEGDDCTVRGCHVFDLLDKPRTTGYQIEDCTNTTVADCTGINVGDPASSNNVNFVQLGRQCFDTTIRNIKCRNVGGYGLRVGYTDTQTPPKDVLVSDFVSDAEVRLNKIQGDVTLEQVRVEDGDPVTVYAEGEDMGTVRVRDCEAERVRVFTNSGNTVASTSISGCDVERIIVDADGSWGPVSIRDNVVTLSTTGSRAIDTSSLPSESDISRNKVYGAGGGSSAINMIDISPVAVVRVEDNDLIDAEGSAVAATSGRPIIVDNYIDSANQQGGGSDRYGAAIQIDAATGGRVESNDFAGTTQTNDIFETSNADDMIYIANDVTRNGMVLNGTDQYEQINRGYP